MHCEQAPCEMGCPVHATSHSPEGVNQMVYNRCIGTRTCSSFCPYKVRRFNFYDYRAPPESSLHAVHNPDVTVRSRGVMEKCTYCTQRIEAAHVAADKENRPLRDGEVVTACQAACPTKAIVFGDINDSSSEVSRLRRDGRHYVLLEELGTRPRTTYLARWRDDGGEG
jgi:molybdopterin-containing oxidoreductase family iron-sulfur binding subunit